MKRCKRCGEEKSLDQFNFCSNTNGQRKTPHSYCKLCALGYYKGWRAKNKESEQRRLVEKSRKYRRENPQKRSEMARAREARKRDQFVEHVDVYVLFERDKGKCGICGLNVPLEEVSMDHVVPLSKGGEHSYANTQASHLRCNMLKSDKLLGGVT